LVDSPAGVGYSYADHEDDYTTDDTSRVADLYDFLSKVRMVYDTHSIYCNNTAKFLLFLMTCVVLGPVVR
jgi:carboxypeptidase C (cathepsin A)